MDFGEQGTDQWCYVSSECDLASTGAVGLPVKGATASWKKCSPGQDRLLGEMTPDELNKVRGDENLNLGLLTKMAYPIWAKTKWPEVKGFFLAPEGAEAAALSPELR